MVRTLMFFPYGNTVENNIFDGSSSEYGVNFDFIPKTYLTTDDYDNNLYRAGSINISNLGLAEGIAGTNLTTLSALKTMWSTMFSALSNSDTNSINNDPLFTNQAGFDLSLNYLSPAIDTGHTSSYTTDILGNPIYGTPDIGAYEYQPPYDIDSALNYPTQDANIRIYANSKYRYKAASGIVEIASLIVTPQSGFGATTTEWMDLNITTWTTADKQWTESSTAIGSGITSHTIGDLEVGKYYTVSYTKGVGDKTAINTFLANGSGKISFDYDQGYSTVTFDVEEDTTAPTIPAISSITPTASQLTIASSTATDIESGLHTTPYQFQETTENIGATSSAYQASTSYTDTGLASNALYTYKVRVKDAAGNESDYSSTSSKYTLAPTPTNLTSSSTSTTSINLSVDAINNPTSGSSGYYFSNTTNSTNSTWIRTNAWQDTGLSCGTTYSYSVIYKNGDGTETTASTTSVTTTSCPTGGFNPGPVFTNTPTTTTPTPPTTTEQQATQNNLLAQIKELQDKITLLKQQIQEQTITNNTSNAPLFTKILKYNDRNQDVINLQTCLKNKYPDIYPEGMVSGWFGPLTLKAVKLFQETYREEILTPAGFSKSTGIVGEYTMRKLNVGCR
jgi:hypothetical protein